MNRIRYCFAAFFIVAFLNACGTIAKKPDEKPAGPVISEVGSSEDAEVNVIEEINKLDERLTQRLNDLEKLIKTNSQLIQKNIAKRITKSNKVVANKPKSLSSNQSKKIVIGEVEWVYLHTLNQSLKSRVDSGATTSSITASNIQPFERDGKDWVKFDVMHRATETAATIEAPVVRKARIKQASLEAYERRFVVSLDISLGNSLKQKAEFTLADRSEMTFPILLGREFLQDITLIDVGKRFLHPKYKPEAK